MQEICIGDKCPLGYCSDYNRRERQPRGLCVTGDQAFPAPSATQADTGQEPLCCLPYLHVASTNPVGAWRLLLGAAPTRMRISQGNGALWLHKVRQNAAVSPG